MPINIPIEKTIEKLLGKAQPVRYMSDKEFRNALELAVSPGCEILIKDSEYPLFYEEVMVDFIYSDSTDQMNREDYADKGICNRFTQHRLANIDKTYRGFPAGELLVRQPNGKGHSYLIYVVLNKKDEIVIKVNDAQTKIISDVPEDTEDFHCEV